MRIKKILALTLVLALLAPMSALAAGASAVKLNITKRTLYVGDTLQLLARVSPASMDQAVRWRCNGAKVSVDETGMVTALAAGTATVTAVSGSKKASCKLTIKKPVAEIKLSKKQVNLEKGKTHKLTASALPKSAGGRAITFSSSNKRIATVSKAGVIKGVRDGGQCVVTAKTANGVQAKCVVNVVSKSAMGFVRRFKDEGEIAPLDVSDLNCTVYGVPVDFGMSYGQAVSRFPGATPYRYCKWFPNQEPLTSAYHQYPGATLFFYQVELPSQALQYRATSIVYDFENKLDHLVTKKPDYTNPFPLESDALVTARGIKIGDSPEDVVKAYGTPHGGGPGGRYYTGTTLTFECMVLDYWLDTPEGTYQFKFMFDERTNKLAAIGVYNQIPYWFMADWPR